MAKRKSFKIGLIEVLNDLLLQHSRFEFSWHCTYCDMYHSGDLLKKVVSIKDTDEQIIELLDKEEALFAVISISKNKTLNKKVAEKYQSSGTIYIQINPTGNEENITASLTKPQFVDTCLNPKCEACGGYTQSKNMWIVDSYCWKCEQPMKVAVMDCNGYHGGPDRFSDQELALARSKGVIIQNNYSKTLEEHYLSNTCPACNNFTGDHFLFTGNYCGAAYGDLKFEVINLGYACKVCN